MFAWLIPATTGPAGGIGGQPLPLGAIVGGLAIVALPYAIAVVVGARRGRLRTGRDEIRTEPGPPSSTVSVHAALAWLAKAPERRAVVVTGAGRRHAALEPAAGGVTLGGFDGAAPMEPRDVGPIVADVRARTLLAAELERLIGAGAAPSVTTFEWVSG